MSFDILVFSICAFSKFDIQSSWMVAILLPLFSPRLLSPLPALPLIGRRPLPLSPAEADVGVVARLYCCSRAGGSDTS